MEAVEVVVVVEAEAAEVVEEVLPEEVLPEEVLPEEVIRVEVVVVMLQIIIQTIQVMLLLPLLSEFNKQSFC